MKFPLTLYVSLECKGANKFQIPNMSPSMDIADHVLNYFPELKEAKPRVSCGKMMPGLRTASLAFPHGTMLAGSDSPGSGGQVAIRAGTAGAAATERSCLHHA